MIPDYYTRDSLVIQHRHHLLQEAEHERKVALIDSPQRTSRGLPRLAGRLGIGLLVLGTKLKQFEQHHAVGSAPARSR